MQYENIDIQRKANSVKTKIIALVLVGVMMMTVVAAVADAPADGNMTEQSGVIGEFPSPDEPESYSDKVVIYKEITAYNPETCEVNAPTITFNYTIGKATVASGTTVTDNASRHKKNGETDVNVKVAVKEGIAGAKISGTAEGVLAITPANKLKSSEYGTANRFALTVDFSGCDWATQGSGAGVYRYQIIETTVQSVKEAAGIKDGNNAANDTLFLDVYVDGFGDVYGYVLFSNNVSIDGSTSEDTAASTAGKVEGFVDEKDEHVYSSTDESTADKYYTFNFDVSKEVKNDAYALSQKHEFPFTVTFENENVKAAVLPIIRKTGDATLTIPDTAAAIASFSYDGTAASPTKSLTIGNAAVVSFVGIPCGTTVTINEKNDVTGVSYNSVSTGAHTNADAKAINTGDTSNNATITCTTHVTRATENHSGEGKVLFTNTLLQISPTGVTLRFAPYILILAAGIVLLLVSRRRKSNIEK